nr:serine/threonine receptor-like kinase nfp [Quercus suber]
MRWICLRCPLTTHDWLPKKTVCIMIKKGDSYYVVSTNSFENLANWHQWHVVEGMNSTLDPSLLHIGVEVIFPMFYKCPSKQEVANGVQNLITYVWQPVDDVLQVSAKFNATAANIEDQNYYQNFSTAVGLPKVNHANLVKLMGTASDTEGTHFLVYEYVERGSLDKWLHVPAKSSKSLSFLTRNQILNIALDVANGLHYMHEHTRPTIVHRDIRAANIRLDSKFKAKIANFSMARSATNSLMPTVDVFAFGVVLLELLSGKKAMETKESGVLSLAALARACTLDKSSARPSMAEIVFSLSVLTQSSPEASEGSWTAGIEGEEITRAISPITAR